MNSMHPDAADGLVLLLACHERIRRLVRGVAALAALEDPLDPRGRPTAAWAVRYLREGLVLHARDEDQSLVPALLELPTGAAAVDAIDRMEDEHVRIERELRHASRLLEEWLSAPGSPPRRVLGASERLDGVLSAQASTVEVKVRLVDGAGLAWVYRHGDVVGRRDDDEFAHLTVRMDAADLARFRARETGAGAVRH